MIFPFSIPFGKNITYGCQDPFAAESSALRTVESLGGRPSLTPTEALPGQGRTCLQRALVGLPQGQLVEGKKVGVGGSV